MNKKLKRELNYQINCIAKQVENLALYYNEPRNISNLRNILFKELNKLRDLIK